MNFPESSHASAKRGFTLAELIVAIAIFLLLVALLGEIINYANLAFSASSKQIECASQARIAFDRLGEDLNARVKEGGATIIVNKFSGSATAGENDSLCFLSFSRTSENISVPNSSGLRFGVFGFAEQLQADPTLSNSSVPMLTWGNGALTWSAQDTTQVDSELIRALSRAANDCPSPTASTIGTGTSNMLEWVPLGTGIVRLEISFLEDDGSVVAVPPVSNNTSYANATPAFPSTSYPLALTASTSADPNHRYVTALIVGMAVLDSRTRKLLVSNSGFQQLNNGLYDVANTAGQQTPLQVWSLQPTAWLQSHAFPTPVAQAIRFYQRTFSLAL